MLLKKQEQNDKIKAIYASSNICASIYEKTTKDLTIIFNNGGQYKYPNVSETDYTRFELADSQGVVFNSHIKKYDFEKLDKINPEKILKEITELKEMDKKVKQQAYTKRMIESMQDVVTFFNTTDTLDMSLYNKLKSSMGEYEKITASSAAPVIND
jgi:hypothetical protein